MEISKDSIRVLLFPWLAHGHISPFLELAKKLSHRNFHIFFCSTPVNLSSIKEEIAQNYSLSIQLVELHLPTLPELPPHYHTTKGLPPHLMPTLKRAFHMSSPSFSNILKTLNPDLLIYDFIQPWAPAAALSYNIPAVQFYTTGAAATTYVVHLFQNPGVNFPFPKIYFRDYENDSFANMIEASNADGAKDDVDRSLECLGRSCKLVLIKTFKEMEQKYIDFLSILCQKKVLPVGPLVQEPVEVDDQMEIIAWLDKKDQNSAVFVSFGSEYFLSKEESDEIAHALELSKVNFIWVVRFPEEENISVAEALSKGFLERVGERGMVIEGWAPQAKILRHSSIGGFVSHCGWSSVMEGIKFGVPILAVPMHLDQPLNARLVEEVGVGVEVKRDKYGRIDKEEVAKVIKEVVVEKSGDVVRRKARELSENMNEKEDEEIDGVVKELVKLSAARCRTYIE